MRIFFLLLLLIHFNQLFAQNDTTVIFYDRQGNICGQNDAIKAALQMKEDNAYKRIKVDLMNSKIESVAYFSDSAYKLSEGPYRELYANGKTRTLGYYHANKKINAWKTWSDDGKLTDSFFYSDGYISGIGLSWNKEGVVIDSLIFEKDGNGISRGYWNDGTASQRGSYKAGKKDGLWTYYYHSGKKCQEVKYMADSAVSYTCYDENENIQRDCIYEKEANFPGGDQGWKQYLRNSLANFKLPNDYYNGTIYGEVWLQFVVDVDGKITDVKVIQSAEPSLDEIAVKIIKNSPRWQHAVQYNRPVKAYRRQPITFARVTN